MAKVNFDQEMNHFVDLYRSAADKFRAGSINKETYEMSLGAIRSRVSMLKEESGYSEWWLKGLRTNGPESPWKADPEVEHCLV